MKVKYPEIGVCGLSCRLCPSYHTDAKSRCGGCKSESRMAAGCPFITCAVKEKGIEFCWQCQESPTCEKWSRHRETGKSKDSFKCYQKLEDNIAFLQRHGEAEFEQRQKLREALLREMLQEFNAGRSKSFYCIAAEVLEIDELKEALARGRATAKELEIKEKAKILHAILNEIAEKKNYHLKLRS